MTDNINTNNTPAVSPEIAKAEIRLSLTKAELNIQAALDKVAKLVFNEDNLTEIKDTITAIKKIQKAIDDAHEAGKAPHWAACTAWDAAKRDLNSLLAPTLDTVDNKYTKLCQAAEKTKRENDAKEKRKKDIEDKITTTILGFSQEITAAKTTKELTSIQNKINAEQGLKTVYLEFLPNLIECCAGLNPLLKDQKEAIKKLEGLETAKEEALATGDDEALMKIEEEKEEIGGRIQETKVRVEEKAINTSIRSYGGGGGYTQTFPTIKAERTTWKSALYDVKAAVKSDLSLLKVELNPEFVKVKLKTLQETGILQKGVEGKEDVTIGGIRYYLDKTY